MIVNTVLSLLAVDYPAEKLACYASDDGCSPLTFLSLLEASEFAKLWVPVCKKYGVKVRAPFRYFSDQSLTSGDDSSQFRQEWQIMKASLIPSLQLFHSRILLLKTLRNTITQFSNPIK
ncbi:hypothetical protein Nepgr_012864 [Nepenthes gracilis]|uniref:Cellulose synthase n=1 Tax=Nepenthes gracilis TaxID=150966 RepID=A0AAD3XNG9_NEPGR|nr:hypothetical protein Nepgr_012864 [Nepenthes gracilis]